MSRPGRSAIYINEYVKNIRLHTFAPTFAIFQKIFSSKFPWYLPHNIIEYLRWKTSRVTKLTIFNYFPQPTPHVFTMLHMSADMHQNWQP